MADRRDHRGVAGGHGAGQGLVIEGPQVFQRTAATGEQDHVITPAGIGGPEQAGELWRGGLALHQAGQQVDLQQWVAAGQHAQYIAHGGAGGRGDHCDPARMQRQFALARRLEQPFCLQPGLELLERPAQGAFAGLLHVLDHQLVVASWRVQGQLAAQQYTQPFARGKAQRGGAQLEHGRAHLGTGVLQREVQMP